MSYLVDALKKAERERREQPVADMQSLSASEQVARRAPGSGLLRWIVAVLVVCNLALVVYLLGDTADTDAGKAPAKTAQRVAEAEAPGDAQPGAVATQPEQRPVRTPTAERSDPPVRRQPEQPPSGARRSDAGARGQVTYATKPLENTSTPARDFSSRPAPARAAPANTPAVDINGHLYSTVPGRSFILVGGRRYHEGERLAAGPAIESIDPTGATLNYRGQRYHVNGPR